MRSFVIFVLLINKNKFTTMDMNTNVLGNEPLTLSEDTLSHINRAQKWTKFLSILGFIGLGILILAGVAMIVMGLLLGTQINEMSSFPFAIMGVVYLILGAVSFVPTLYLYKFSENGGTLVNYRRQDKVEETFRYLGKYYQFVGIMTIVVIAVYLLAIPVVLLFGIYASH